MAALMFWRALDLPPIDMLNLNEPGERCAWAYPCACESAQIHGQSCIMAPFDQIDLFTAIGFHELLLSMKLPSYTK